MNGPDRPAGLGSQKKLWRAAAPNLQKSNRTYWALFILALMFSACVVYTVQADASKSPPGRSHFDFVYFYGMGQIAGKYPADRIYDFHLQQQTFTALTPMRSGAYGPSPYPPFVPLFFIPFTWLSIQSAYFLWMAISLSLYLVGVIAAARAAFPRNHSKLPLILTFAVSFSPFLISTLTSGQLSSVAVCAVGIALYEEGCDQSFRSGLALSLLSYKPTLLLLLLPMMLLTRRFRTLAGFAAGAGAMALVATAFAGVHIWVAYAHMSRFFAYVAASLLERWQYVDLRSSFAAVAGGGSGVEIACLIAVIGASALSLAFLMWRSTRYNRPAQWLMWASTLTWTMLLNVYTPVYDSVLVIPALILTVGALRNFGWRSSASWIKGVALIIFAVAWFSESLARTHQIQLLTAILLVFGTMQLLLLYRAIRERSTETALG